MNDIRAYMLSNLHYKWYNDKMVHYYCGEDLYYRIRYFWNTLDKNKIFYLINYDYRELDLTGNHTNLLPEDELGPMIVSYLYNELDMDKEMFLTQFNIKYKYILIDSILKAYDNIDIKHIRDKKLTKLLNNVL